MIPVAFGGIRIGARVLATDRHGVPLDDITPYVLSASVDLDTRRTVSPFLFRAELRETGIIDAYRDHVQPWLRLEFLDGQVVDEPVGLYAVAPPQRHRTYQRTTEFCTGHDHTWRTATSSFTAPYTVPAGANVVAAVETILHGEGFVAADLQIAPSPKTLVTAATWGLEEPATKLETVNSLLAAIGYVNLHSSRQGRLVSFPLPDLELGAVNKQFSNASGEVTAQITEDPDVSLICNVVRVINSRDGQAPIVAVAENHNPASPVSIEAIDRVLYREIRDAHIPDQATADEIARRALQDGATYDNQVTIITVPDPTRNPHDVYEFDLTQAPVGGITAGGTVALAGRWRCTGWALGFTARAATMRQRIGKVVPV